ncbi:hypothetical protein [Rhodococcus jostii]|uniref:hypothetical protein n=1 Tax=Rhodococcus jostii TaxID=132919 RepID=UPI00363C2DFF
MSVRDELAGIIRRDYDLADPMNEGFVPYEGTLADTILAAGYRKLQVVTTEEEVKALPLGTVLRTRDGGVAEIEESDHHVSGIQLLINGSWSDCCSWHFQLPATVLIVPETAT